VTADLLAGFALPFAVAVPGTALLIRLAPRLGLLDMPAARKVHTTPTPKGGGLAIVAAVALTSAVFWWTNTFGSPVHLAQLGLGLVIALLGLVDDLRPLPWQLRLGVQAVVAAAAVPVCLPDVGIVTGAAAAFWMVAMINAFNMLDNMDALSAGVAFLAAGWLALAAGAAGALPHVMLMGALLGFLCFNRPPARIFMGDAGSTFLGFTLGVETARAGLAPNGPPWVWALPLAILAVPCYDMTSVVFLRLKQGRSPFHADKQHLSHRLVERGLSKKAAVGVIYLLALASGATGLALLLVTTPLAATLVGGQFVVWWVAFAVVEWLSVRRTPSSP
jgi:UDP-GlcNAc:undecaprenyl-phosphate GlcNAc-1-phosphate transferase